MKIVAIKDMSAGNDTIGEVWKETKIFEENRTVLDVMLWVGAHKSVILTIPDNSLSEFHSLEKLVK